MRDQSLCNRRHDRRTEWVIKRTHEIGFRRLKYGGIGVDAADLAASSDLRRQAREISERSFAQFARELDADDLLEGETGGQEQDPAVARAIVEKSEPGIVDRQFVER